MDDQFQNTRFAIFCKLNGTGGNVSDFANDVAREADLQQELGSGEKEVTRLYDSVTRMVIDKKSVRHVLKVYVDEHQYKSITVSESTSAKQVCAIGAKKFGLSSWSYSLVVQKAGAFEPLADNALPAEVIAGCVDQGITDIKFFFVAPRLNKDNLEMRKRAVQRYLNHYLGAFISPITRLGRDVSDGVVIAKYVEYLLDKKNIAVHSSPSNKKEKEENLKAAFAALAEAGVRLNGDPVAQLIEGKEETITAVVWNILFRYCTVRNTLNWDQSLTRYESNPNEFVFLEAVMAWCKSLASTYAVVSIDNYCTSWADGMAMAAMLEMTDNYVASAHRLMQIENPKERLATAIEMAHGLYNVPPLMQASDFDDISSVDEWTVNLYVTVLATELNKKRQQRFSRQALVAMGASPDAGVPEGPVPMKIFFEGNADFDSKMYKLQPGITSDELREMVAGKLHCDPNSFWIFQQENQVERNVGAGESLLTNPRTQVVTIKFVAGSHYYVHSSCP
eukprot:TRINITY_DN2737_c0_g1_i2.p1 TRINITY_DN2737_c0_g1~~TRINITY_DN2737_c0_g1_i2.p1  ORF type:complete len:537 (+),score=98.04 TRINITY_DN2737_c0_g1_i2:95-1612(+)